MTYKELYLEMHPECEDFEIIARGQCPNGAMPGMGPIACAEGRVFEACEKCWNREIPEGTYKVDVNDALEPDPMWPKENPHILDSGHRREFESGAVRDICEGKGRCDLMPLDVVAEFMTSPTQRAILWSISEFQETGDCDCLIYCLRTYVDGHLMVYKTHGDNLCLMLLEVAKHFEEGCKKYGDNNWQKGIPVRCYIDSAVRHYLKFLRGDKDEPHDRAFCWNILCCIWTCKHKPELNDYAKKEDKDVKEN